MTTQTKHTAAETSQQIGISSNGTPEIVNHNQKVEIVAIEPSANVTPNDLLRLAIQSNADLDRLDKLMDLQLRWEANEARKTYVVAMSQFRAKCPQILRTRDVDFTSAKGRTQYKFAGLSETIEVIKSLLSECGLSHSWRTSQNENGSITVTCRVTHTGGHFEETSLTAPPDDTGNKNRIQAIGSTAYYLERYTLFALLGLASQDMDSDGNGNGGRKEPASQQRLIDMLIGDACKQFTAKKRSLLSSDSEIDLGKFKEQLRAVYSILPTEQKQKFEWNAKTITSLSDKIDVNKVVVRKEPTNGAGTKGQHRGSVPESQTND